VIATAAFFWQLDVEPNNTTKQTRMAKRSRHFFILPSFFESMTTTKHG